MYQKAKKFLKSLKKTQNSADLFLKNVINNTSNSDLIIDVGANVGNVSKMFFGTGCEIVAIEPNLNAYQKLSELCTKYKKIKPLNAAACTFNGEANLFLHENSRENNLYYSTGSSLLKNKTNVDSSNFEKVCALDLSEFIKKQRRPIRLLKIDIEGYEDKALKPFFESASIELYPENIVIEFTSQNEWQDQNFISYLIDKGYKEILKTRGNLCLSLVGKNKE